MFRWWISAKCSLSSSSFMLGSDVLLRLYAAFQITIASFPQRRLFRRFSGFTNDDLSSPKMSGRCVKCKCIHVNQPRACYILYTIACLCVMALFTCEMFLTGVPNRCLLLPPIWACWKVLLLQIQSDHIFTEINDVDEVKHEIFCLWAGFNSFNAYFKQKTTIISKY